MRRFYKSHYTAANTLVVIVGDFKTREALGWLGREFRSMSKGARPRARPGTILQTEPSVRQLKKPVQQAYAVYAFPTPPAAHPDQEALDLLAVLLGDGRNARLIHTLREEKKLVWSVGASNITQEGQGLFAIFAECDIKKRPLIAPAVRAILQDLKKHPPTSEEISRANKNVSCRPSWLQGGLFEASGLLQIKPRHWALMRSSAIWIGSSSICRRSCRSRGVI